jgi:hypothetical protein
LEFANIAIDQIERGLLTGRTPAEWDGRASYRSAPTALPCAPNPAVSRLPAEGEPDDERYGNDGENDC